MKTKYTILTILLSLAVITANAQLRVLPNGKVGVGVNQVHSNVQMDVDGEVRIRRNLHIGYLLGQGYNPTANRGLTINNGPSFNWRFIDLENDTRLIRFQGNGVFFIQRQDIHARHTLKFDVLTRSFSTHHFTFFNIGSSTNTLNFRYNGSPNYCYAREFVDVSDESLKEEIEDLNRELIESLRLLRPVEFLWREPEIENDSIALLDIDSPFCEKRKSYGFISQEVELILPELVTEVDGLKYLSYQKIIPLLVAAVQDLLDRVDNCCGTTFSSSDESSLSDTLNKGMNKFPNSALTIKGYEQANKKPAVLHQNAPNPFTQQTEIKYFIPKDARQADLNIYNMMGSEIRSIRINERENGKQVIHGYELEPGMYIYSLIVDGKEIDTKRMILTK
jgi:predicted  nucleic acid-binding Zn-ribbon protein